MPINHGREPGRSRIEVEPVQFVEDVKQNAIRLHNCSLRVAARPVADINITTDGGNRRNFAQFVDNRRFPDIPGVNYVFNPFQRFECLRSTSR